VAVTCQGNRSSTFIECCWQDFVRGMRALSLCLCVWGFIQHLGNIVHAAVQKRSSLGQNVHVHGESSSLGQNVHVHGESSSTGTKFPHAWKKQIRGSKFPRAWKKCRSAGPNVHARGKKIWGAEISTCVEKCRSAGKKHPRALTNADVQAKK